MRLSPTQKRALGALRPDRALGLKETGVAGDTIVALHSRGLVHFEWTDKPYRRIVGTLSPAGVAKRDELGIESEWA